MNAKAACLAVLVALAPAARAAADAADASADADAAAALVRLDSAYLRFKKYPVYSAAQIQLGRRLFFDPRMSAGRNMSCSTCHQPDKAWTDGLPRARGAGGKELPRNAPTLLDVRDYSHFFWDGRAASLEEQALSPIQNPDEMGMDLKVLVARLDAIPDYAREFRESFGGPPSGPLIGKALAAFESTIVSAPDSPFSRFRRDPAALSASQKRGLVLFAGKAHCFRCHTGPLLMDDFFHNTGLKPTPGLDDLGRYPFDPEPAMRRAFRTPSLREVGRTAPYMHDGSLKTLSDVVEFYDRGGDVQEGQDYFMLPLGLTDQEKADLVAFLESLSSTPRPVAAPVLPSAPVPLAEVDALISRAEKTLAAQSAERPAAWGAAARCGGEFSVAGLVAELDSKSADAAAAAALKASVLDDLISYYQYAAWSKGSPDVCAGFKLPTKSYGVPVTGEHACRVWWHEQSMISAIVRRDPGFKQVCLQASAIYFRDLTAADSAEVCGIIERNLDHPDRLCAEAAPRFLNPDKRRSCEIEFERYLRYADPEICRPLEGTDVQLQYCRDIVAYARAYHGGAPALCGDSETCRALMGGAPALAAHYAGLLKTQACAFFAATPPPGSGAAGAEGLLERGHALLAEAESDAAPVGIAEARAIDAREEKIARLRQRYSALLHDTIPQ